MRIITQDEFDALDADELRHLITHSGGWLDVVDWDGQLWLGAYPERMRESAPEHSGMNLWIDLDEAELEAPS